MSVAPVRDPRFVLAVVVLQVVLLKLAIAFTLGFVQLSPPLSCLFKLSASHPAILQLPKCFH